MNEFAGYRVLLAEESDVTRETMAKTIADIGAECVAVGDGDSLLRELLESTADKGFDMVLASLDLPYRTGQDACSAFRASNHPKASSMPFFGLVSCEDVAAFDTSVSAGLSGMMQKPVSREVLASHFTISRLDGRVNSLYCQRVRNAIAAAKSKSFFFSTVSHDIRTPLNAIIGFSQLLKLGFETQEEHDKAVDSILVSGKTLLQLINDVLDLSKLEAGKMSIEPEPTDCRKLIEEIIVSFRAANTKSDLDIRSVIGPMPKLMIDPQRLRQIVFNLVGNAVKFTKQGHVEVRMAFDKYPDANAGTVRLEVDDTGCGISEADQQRIATPYVQVGSRNSRHGGTGLGLSICRQLTEAMDGEIELQSAVGCGTTFYVTIPNIAVGSGVALAKKSATQRIAVNLQTGVDLSTKRFLIIDDSKMNITVLKTMLTRLGVKDIAIAHDGVEGLDIIAEEHLSHPFDYVLTDMWMPRLDGEGFVREIRKVPELANLPVYAVTADVEHQKDYSEIGFTGILLKPLTFESIKDALGVL